MEGHWNDSKFIIFATGTILQACSFFLAYYYKNRNARSIDEGFEDVSRIEENPERKILVLGLESCGKSTILSHLTSPACQGTQQPTTPTEGFNVVTLDNDGVTLKIYEIGGRDGVRQYWENYLQDTDLLVFVVDSTLKNIATSAIELKKLIGDDRLAHVPVLVLANKQDLKGAMTTQEVSTALDLNSIPVSKHRVQVYGTQCPPGSSVVHPSVNKVKDAFFLMTSNLP